MNNLAIDFSKLSSDSTAMDEIREKYAKEQNMEAVKFREFHFSIPANETTLIDMAELIEKKANVFKNKVAANEDIQVSNRLDKLKKMFDNGFSSDSVLQGEELKEARYKKYAR